MHATAFLAVAGEGALSKQGRWGGGRECGGALFRKDHVEVVFFYIYYILVYDSGVGCVEVGVLPGRRKHRFCGSSFRSFEPTERNTERESGTSRQTRRASTSSLTPNGQVPVIGRPKISEIDQPRSKRLSRGKQEESSRR